MRLDTNSEVDVLLPTQDSVPVAKIFKIARRLSHSLTLGEFREHLNSASAIATIDTSRNDMADYLANLSQLAETLAELDSESDGIIIDREVDR